MTRIPCIPSVWQSCASMRKGYAVVVRTMDHAKRDDKGSGST
jgi:hypothetical protein